MKTVKRNSSQTFPIKLNYRTNEILYTSYRNGKSTSNLKLINVNKNKLLEENKSFYSNDKNYKNESYISNYKYINDNRNKIRNTSSYLSDLYNNNHNQPLLSNNYGNNIKKYYNNNNSSYCSYKNRINESYISNYFLTENSNISNIYSKYNTNSTIGNINQNNNSIFSFIKSNDTKNLFNKKQIYQKPKNERTLSSYSFIITDYNSNKENLNTQNNHNKYLLTNLNQFGKYTNLFGQRNTDVTRCITSINMNNDINYNDKSNQSFFNYRRTNIDYSKLNLYSPKDTKDNYTKNNKNYIKRCRPRLKSDRIRDDDIMNVFNDNDSKTYNDSNKSYIYVRKNSSKKYLIKKNSSNYSLKTNSNKDNKNKIRVNLKSNNILENAIYVQKNVILIQKNYRMHLGILKKYILKTIKNIIEGTNKLYYLFYKNISKKFIYILNNAFIKSINIDLKTSKIIPKFSKKSDLIENNKNNEISKQKYFIMKNFDKNKKLGINFNTKFNLVYSPRPKIEAKPKFKNPNLIKIKKDINTIRKLKEQIVNKMNKYKK